ncbi:(+)-neomenthol dehydrogenase [Canna indica]|uniref:Short-chain dehydrogenase/reductase n=1 Tax=Canna indica TaxID=4628 RepID=A0AAQ3KA71_9LILI|nr:(+)-neomenthol dehydrogenase [Canna indica]
MDIDSKVISMTSSSSSSSPIRWWSEETVAVVTGANKGIGFALVKRLAELGLTVVLTARDVAKGKEAVESLAARGLRVEFCRLDVADGSSILAFAAWLKRAFGGLDILVNNAAVSFNEIDTNSVEHAETVIRTNFYGSKLLIEALLPLFRRCAASSRILNMSSQLGLLSKVSNPTVREVLGDEERLTVPTIEHLVASFLDHVKAGTWEEQGWPKVWTDYSVSKLALNAYSRLLAKQEAGRGLSVNCFCPGFTRTSMTRGRGRRTPEEAAEVAAMLVLLPPREVPTGKFFKWRTPALFSKL